MKKNRFAWIIAVSILLSACGGGGESSAAASSSSGTTEASSEPQQTSEASSTESSETLSEISSEEPSMVSSSTEPDPVIQDVRYLAYEDSQTKTEALGQLEKFAVENKLTGLTLYGDGSYLMYHPSVVKGAEEYVPGYGFGVLEEGDLTGDLEGETNEAWKRYCHISEDADPHKINAMNCKIWSGRELNTLVGASYYARKLAATKDHYEWSGELSPQRHAIAMDANEKGYATTYRVEVKVGDEVRYGTMSEKYASFNGRSVALEDYVTPYKILYTQAYHMARGGENLTGVASFVGTKDYYAGSKEGFNEELWEQVGIRSIEEGEKAYLEFTFNYACDLFHAMYYLSSPMLSPVPAEFITEIGGGDFAAGTAVWGTETESETIADHWLSVGPYQIEEWAKDEYVAFKRNPYYQDGDRYRIQGVHVQFIPSDKTFSAFLESKLHFAYIPSNQWAEYCEDPRVCMTSNTGTYRLNMNTCDEAFWEKQFGENGAIVQTPKEDYWEVEPAMSNKDFVSGLSFALDRKTLAKMLGRVPSMYFFGENFILDELNGISYMKSPEHKAAIASIAEGTDGYGYSLEKARESFRKASEKLIEEGFYKAGDEIEIEVAWQTKDQITSIGEPLAEFWTEAFNDGTNPLTLKVTQWVGDVWSDIYYKKMMVGQYDIGFGTISGSSMSVYLPFECLCSDNRSNFTLNWGTDTNAVDPEHVIHFAGKEWSYDSLLNALTLPTYTENGALARHYDIKDEVTLSRKENGDLLVEGFVRQVALPKEGVVHPESDEDYDALSLFEGMTIWGQPNKDNYHESDPILLGQEGFVVEPNDDPYFNVKFAVTFPKDVVATVEKDKYRLGFDFYFHSVLCDMTRDLYGGSVLIEPGSIPPIEA